MNPDLPSRRVGSIPAYLRVREYLQEIEEAIALPREVFLADRKGRDLIAYYTMLAIQGCIDLASRYVADAGWPVPTDADSPFDELTVHGVIDRELAATMHAAADLRDLIEYSYDSVDSGRLYDSLRQDAADFQRFLRIMA